RPSRSTPLSDTSPHRGSPSRAPPTPVGGARGVAPPRWRRFGTSFAVARVGRSARADPYRSGEKMTTGGNSSDGPMGDPYGSGPGSQGHGQGYGQSAYGGQPYGNDPYGGQPYGEPFPQPGADNGPVRSGPIDATDAISAGWSLFKNNPLPWVLISLITLVIRGLVGALGVTDSAAMATFANLLSIVVGLVLQAFMLRGALLDRKSTRLNSSHVSISYAVFCLKKKMKDPSNC